MTTETRRRIRAYKKALPELRERVIAVALLLAMSVSMLASASFAWITLSRAPEVSNMQTTVAANGNLEIALVDPEGNVPAESKEGDSSEKQGIVASNLTWGNLINLSDPSYGLNKIVLRPALLSDYNRNKYPLYGATYGADGRVVSVSSRYEFATHTKIPGGTDYYFAAGDASTFGVRAISSVKYENISGNSAMTEMWTIIDKAYGEAQTKYLNLIEGKTTVNKAGTITCIDALEGMVQTYAQEVVDQKFPSESGFVASDYSGYVTYFYRMMGEFMGILELEGEALRNLANLQAYIHDSSVGTNHFKTLDELLTAYKNGSLTNKGVTLESLATFYSNYTTLKADLNGNMKSLAEQCDPDLVSNPPKVEWSQIKDPVGHLVDVNKTELEGMPIGGMSSDDIGTLMGLLDGKTKSVVIKGNCIIRQFEQRCGAGANRMADKDVLIKVTLDVSKVKVGFISGSSIGNKGIIEVPAKVTTDAEAPYLSANDRETTLNLDSSSIQGGDATAKDTYGMAVDLWVRTNAKDSILTLEGTVLTEEIPDTCTDKNGNSTELYSMAADGKTYDAYKLNDEWYYADSHQLVEKEVLEAATFTPEMIDQVIGYQGENRVWEKWQSMVGSGLISEDSTTQGSGSCFVFYANPTEQTQILELLESFSVAFVDEDGNALGMATLNTDYAYYINGKVTVPLVMINGTTYLNEDDEECIGITALNQNEATRVTAIIYLNGLRLQNQNVLASGSIQGQLNIQFGNNVSLTNPEDRDLQAKYRTITAEAVYGEQASAAVDSPIRFEYDGKAKSVTVNLNVAGEQPERISGFFIRSINNTQGTRGESVDFTKNEDGTWTAAFDLTKPGSYLMRSLIVDGIEYTMDAFPSVEISGLNISSITTSLQTGVHMTADSKLDVDVTAVIDTDPELMPAQVRAQFRDEKGKEFNAIMTYNQETGEWVGTASINVSGTYTLEYLVMDGEYKEIPDQFKTTLIVSLGMSTQVRTSLYPTEFEFTGNEADPVTFTVEVKIRDNGGTEIRAMEDVELIYHSASSSLDQNGLHAELKWNADTGYYVGEMKITKAGRYSFNRLKIGESSTITNTSSAPVFVAMPPDPPAYNTYVANEYQVDMNGNAYLRVGLIYAGSAKVGAKIVDVNDPTKVYEPVLGTLSSDTGNVVIDDKEVTVNYFDFKIPKNSSLNQNGEWQLTELYFQDIFVNGNMLVYTEGVTPGAEESGEFYTIDVSRKGGEKGIYAYVVATLETSFTKGSSTDTYKGEAFGGTKTTPTGAFMTTYTVDPVTLTISDWNGRAIKGITGATWNIAYDDSTDDDYGGYDGATLSVDPVTMVDDGTHTKFTAPAQTFTYAGEYTSNVEVTFSDGSTRTLEHRPKITVASIKPSVTVSAISPGTTEQINTKIVWTKGKYTAYLSYDYQVPVYNELTTTDSAVNVKVYAKAGAYGTGDASFTLPVLTFAVTGLDGNNSKVKFTIPQGPTGRTRTGTTYAPAKAIEITGNTTKEVTFGKTDNVYRSSGFATYDVYGYFGQGESISITEIEIVRNNVTYEVTLDKPINIYNPSSVNKYS